MRYLTVAGAYRDLEQASGRLALVDRLAALLAGTPAGLLPVVCCLCQGLIAPEFAGVDLGLAEKLAVRARQQPDIWFEPGLVLEILSAELTLSRTTPPPGKRSSPAPAWPCASPVHRKMARR